MDMLISPMPGFDTKAFPSADLLEYPLQFLFNVLVSQYLAAILRCPYQMIIADIDTMAELVQSSIGHT